MGPSTNRKGRRAEQQKALADDPNPEGLPEKPTNTLFGHSASKKRRSLDVDVVEEDRPKRQKMSQRAAVRKGDPAAELTGSKKGPADGRGSSGHSGAGAGKRGKPTESSTKLTKSARPHAEAVERSTRIWETLRADKTSADEVRLPLSIIHMALSLILQDTALPNCLHVPNALAASEADRRSALALSRQDGGGAAETRRCSRHSVVLQAG
jgi:hypothetical protein